MLGVGLGGGVKNEFVNIFVYIIVFKFCEY